MPNIQYRINQRTAQRLKQNKEQKEYYAQIRNRLLQNEGREFVGLIKSHASLKGLDKYPNYTPLQIALSKLEKELCAGKKITPRTKQAIIEILIKIEKSTPSI